MAFASAAFWRRNDSDDDALRRNFWRKTRRVAAQIPFAEDLLAAITARLQRTRENHDAAFVYDAAVVNHIISKCNDPDSGGRMIDNIITNTLLPELSREFLKRSLAKQELKEAKVTIENGDFAYGWG